MNRFAVIRRSPLPETKERYATAQEAHAAGLAAGGAFRVGWWCGRWWEIMRADETPEHFQALTEGAR